MATKIAGYWRAVIDRRVISTHGTKAEASKAERDYRREAAKREAQSKREAEDAKICAQARDALAGILSIRR